MPTPIAAHRERITAWAEERGIGELTPKLLELAEPCLGFTTRQANVPIGGTKLGGAPDLATGIRWPKNGDQPLTFMMQIDLAEVAGLIASPLPASGLLSFFFDRSDIHEGVKFTRVIHSEGALDRRDTPADLEVFTECAVDFDVRTSLPELGHGSAYGELFGDVQPDKLMSVRSMLSDLGDRGSNHQLLGYPHGMQGDVLLQRVSSDGIPGNISEKKRCAWGRSYRQLLGLDTDDNAALEWIDMGTLWFLIDENDLARADFSRVTTALQFC